MKDGEIAKLDVSGWPLPDEYLVEIGRISALWSILEDLLNLCIGKLAGFNDLTDPTAFILTTHTTMPQKLHVLGAMCEQLAPKYPGLRGYTQVVSQLEAAQKARNKFLHNAPAFNPETKTMEMPVGSARGSLKTKVEAISTIDLRRAWVLIHLAQNALYQLVLGREMSPVWERK